MIMKECFDWAEGIDCAVTVADRDCVILYQNRQARELYRNHGNLIGKSMLNCHNERSRAIIARILHEGGTNTYTITKKGRKKLIYQTPWRNERGEIAGIAEFSIILPEELPHYNRDAAVD